MYKYGNIEDAEAGDIVEYFDGNKNLQFTKGKLYIVDRTDDTWDHIFIAKSDDDNPSDRQRDCWKLVLTKPGSEAKVGDAVMCIKPNIRNRYSKFGEIYTVKEVLESVLTIKENNSRLFHNSYAVLCKEEEPKQSKFKQEYMLPLDDSQQTKENTMKETKVEITITDEMIKKSQPKKPKTELQIAKKNIFTSIVYNEDGYGVDDIKAKTSKSLDKQINEYLQRNPFHTVIKFVQTDIVKLKTQPVVSKKVKAK